MHMEYKLKDALNEIIARTGPRNWWRAKWLERHAHENSVTRHNIGQGSDLYAGMPTGLEWISPPPFRFLLR